jgi:hypothetical protein
VSDGLEGKAAAAAGKTRSFSQAIVDVPAPSDWTVYLHRRRADRRKFVTTWTIRWMLLAFVMSGCAELRENVHQPGRLPTEEERCAFQQGFYSAGICHTRGGP